MRNLRYYQHSVLFLMLIAILIGVTLSFFELKSNSSNPLLAIHSVSQEDGGRSPLSR